MDQDCFKSEKGWQTLLSLLPADRAVQDSLRKQWESDPDRPSDEKYGDLVDAFKGYRSTDKPLFVRNSDRYD